MVRVRFATKASIGALVIALSACTLSVFGAGSFNGVVDEVAIYDEPLSLSQVSAHYTAAGTR